MNKDLVPIFNVLLPKLEKQQVYYWVYGGISIAAYAGKFVRENKDVDIFVRENDYPSTKTIIEKICADNGFKADNRPPEPATGRPKLNIVINNKERSSLVPVYVNDLGVEFKFKTGSEQYPKRMLEKIPRNISGYKFNSPPNDMIKALF